MSFELVDWAVALVPVLLMAACSPGSTCFKLMSPWEMIACLLLGAVAALIAWPISGQMLDTLPMGYSFYSRIVAPWIEEALKALPVMLLILPTGSATRSTRSSSASPSAPAFRRREQLLPGPLPELTSRCGGARARHRRDARIDHRVLAAVAHELGERGCATREGGVSTRCGSCPAMSSQPDPHDVQPVPGPAGLVMLATLVLAPIVLIGLIRFGEGETSSGWSRKAKATAAGWRNGGWGFPADASGQRSGADGRSKADSDRIREYCMLKTELVLAAEEEMLDRDRKLEGRSRSGSGSPICPARSLRGNRRVGLPRCGRLPFSRNDEWELSELRS
jgi:hypothetical protein